MSDQWQFSPYSPSYVSSVHSPSNQTRSSLLPTITCLFQARTQRFPARLSTYHCSIGFQVDAYAAGATNSDDTQDEGDSTKSAAAAVNSTYEDSVDSAAATADNVENTGPHNAVSSAEIRAVPLEEFQNFISFSYQLHRRHLHEMRVNSTSLQTIENRIQRINESLNTTLRRLNRWARFVHLNHPIRNIGRLHEASEDVVKGVEPPNPDSDSDRGPDTPRCL